MFKPLVMRGVIRTLELTFIAMVIGMRRRNGARGDAAVEELRALRPGLAVHLVLPRHPVYVQILIWGNFAILYPDALPGSPLHRLGASVDVDTNRLIGVFVASILALGLNEAAYAAELVRAGIISVDRGQIEAAESLGMSSALTMRRIILPQAMRVIIPPMGNETISMLKTTRAGRRHLRQGAHDKRHHRLLAELPDHAPADRGLHLVHLLHHAAHIGQHYLEATSAKALGQKETESAEKRALKRLQQKGGESMSLVTSDADFELTDDQSR